VRGWDAGDDVDRWGARSSDCRENDLRVGEHKIKPRSSENLPVLL
jgi:hypothetical protein